MSEDQVDQVVKAAQESQEAERTERRESLGNVVRWVVLLGLLGGGIVAGVVFLKPKPKPTFNPLDTLVYEALTMEDDPDGRLDLPTTNIGEIQDYTNNHPALGFKPGAMREVGNGWQTEGASVIDYDTAKIVVVQFSKPDNLQEKLYMFLYKGNLAELPKAEKGTHNGLTFQTYASESLNVVAWQVREDVMGMVMGHKSAQELATVAQAVTGG